ncbi:hypothetical protein Barb6XT_02267 [Bacteroidales bacterium Barb6XT]|nr:hypothetical protein Barb6XT_02267 [Bacteroidales bacterium Barb6XT]
MKKLFFFLLALLVGASGFAQQQGQQGVFRVQGIPHEYLTKKLQEGKLKKPHPKPPIKGSTHDIDFNEIHVWAGNPNDTLPISRAAFLVKWTDGKREKAGEGDSILAWGYRWNPVDSYNDSVPVHTVDMIKAIANVDPRFTVLLQQAGIYGYAASGFGFNYDTKPTRVPLWFDYKSAATDTTNIKFHYVAPPNYARGQVAVPATDPDVLARIAISESNNTGIIEHPFNIDYGYPAYDFDYWFLGPNDPDPDNHEWQSGWSVNGYWSYYVKNQLVGDFTYPMDFGISYRRLYDNYVDAFVFSPPYPLPANTMDGDYISIPLP